MDLNENPVTANARAGDPMPKLVNTNPGQTGSAEDLGEPIVKPDQTNSIGKRTAAKIKKTKSAVNSGAKPADPMPHLQGGAPGQGGVRESEEYDEEDEISEVEDLDSYLDSMELDVSEDVNAMLSGEDFTEEFKFKASTIFESAVKAKVVEQLEKFEAMYDERLNEEVEEIRQSLEEKVEAFLEYAVSQWLKENQLAIDTGLRSEVAEEFILGLKSLFESCYVDIPEDKYDVLEDLSTQLDEMEEKLNEQIEANIQLNQSIGEYIKDGIIAEVSEGLAHTQRDKLMSLAEGVEFISEESYREKIEMIRESYFPRSTSSSYKEDLVENNPLLNESYSAMDIYVRSIDNTIK